MRGVTRNHSPTVKDGQIVDVVDAAWFAVDPVIVDEAEDGE